MAEIKIQAEPRTAFGKGAARRIRRAGAVPAVLYGHGEDPAHITLPGHDLMMALKAANALLSVEIDGKSQLALPKQVQRDPIKGFIEHADLLLVRRGEKVVVNIPITLVGEAAPDALIMTEVNELTVEAEATHIPGSIEVSIEGLEVGSQIHASELKLPTGVDLREEGDPLIVNATAQPTAEQLEAEMAEAEAEAGVEREEHEEPEDVVPEADSEAESDEESAEDE
ncbi:MAG TPA: 50S ribosomal protein L25/general stress protein Ctc [Nocardioidaceae bacterium]|nr:50S ribosomal protein L25/general stress protein Ctc [Nocardioidaceae bacterium]